MPGPFISVSGKGERIAACTKAFSPLGENLAEISLHLNMYTFYCIVAPFVPHRRSVFDEIFGIAGIGGAVETRLIFQFGDQVTEMQVFQFYIQAAHSSERKWLQKLKLNMRSLKFYQVAKDVDKNERQLIIDSYLGSSQKLELYLI